MGSALMKGREMAALASTFGWTVESGSKHPFLLTKQGKRCVPVRAKLQNPKEIRAILKQPEFPPDDWPAFLR